MKLIKTLLPWAALGLLLSGCLMKLDTTLEVLPDGRVQVEGFWGVDEDLATEVYPGVEGPEALAQTLAQDLASALGPYGATSTPKVEGKVAGAFFQTPPLRLDQAQGLLEALYGKTEEDAQLLGGVRLARKEEGGLFGKRVRLELELPGFADSMAQAVVFRTVTLRLPGKVLETNGNRLDERTVAWGPGGSPFQGYVVYQAPASLFPYLLVLLFGTFALFLFLRRRKPAPAPPPSA